MLKHRCCGCDVRPIIYFSMDSAQSWQQIHNMQLQREEFVKLLEFGESGLRDTACIESGLQGALYRKTPFVLAIASMTRRL